MSARRECRDAVGLRVANELRKAHLRRKFALILSVIEEKVIWCTAANRLKFISENIIYNKNAPDSVT